jgi:hypothetical protein
MPGKKLGYLTLTFILMSTVVVPAFLTDIALAQGSFVNYLSVVQLLDNPDDFKWQGIWNPRFDPDRRTYYSITYVRDYDVRGIRSEARDRDNCVTRDYGRCNVRDCVTCDDRDYDRPGARGCYRCNARDYVGPEGRDRDNGATRDCDRCERCDLVGWYSCDLYDCGTCGIW